MSNRVPESRLKSILHFLANSNDTVTVKQIADEVGVSRRTILREIPELERWLNSNQFELLRKPGQGIVLTGDEAGRIRLREILSLKSSEIVNIPKDRQKVLLAELLQQKEPVKLYYYTSKLGVSASTISNDLDKLEGWLGKYELTLVRKTGFGVYIKGEEKNFRRAMISLLYENLSEEELIKIIKDTVPSMQKKSNVLQIDVRNRLLNLIDRESVEKIENIIYYLEDKLTYKLAESARIGLMVHLALAIQRIKNNENITIDSALLGELKKVKEFVFASDIAKEVAAEFDITVPVDEVGYITMHLKGARVYKNTAREGKFPLRKELTEIARNMISIVEKEVGMDLSQNDKLLYDLVSHLDPAIRRLELNLDIRNPILDKLKQLFPDVYRVSQKAASVLQQRLKRDIPESEIGFIAMHFGAVIEKKKTDGRKVFRAAVACPSGIGSSRLLSARLEKEFSEIEIIDVLSTYEITGEWLAENKVDLIVSTIPIDDCPIKNVCVNPLLLEEDKMLIYQSMGKPKLKDKKAEFYNIDVSSLKNNLNLTVNYCNLLLDILENHKVYIDNNGTDVEEFIKAIARLTAKSEREKKSIEEKLKVKDNLYLYEECVFIQCSAKEVKRSSILFCKVNRQIIVNYCGNNVDTAVVLITPAKKQNEIKAAIEGFGASISTNTNIKKILGYAKPNEISHKVYELLLELYMTKLQEWRVDICS